VQPAESLVSPAQQDKINALKELRDSGMITAQEYEAKVKASSPLRNRSRHRNSAGSLHQAASGTRHVEATDPSINHRGFHGYSRRLEICRHDRPSPGCHGHGPSLKFTAQSADGLTAIVALPGVTWSWTESEAANFLINIAVPNIHPGAKVLGSYRLSPKDRPI